MGLKKLKINIIKKRKENGRRKKKGKLHRTATAQHKRHKFITTIKCVTEYTHIHRHP